MPNFGDKIIVSVSTIYANYATQFYSCSKEKSPKKSSTVSIHCLENEPYIFKHFHECSAHNDLLGDNKFYLSAVFENKNTHQLGWLEPLGNGETRFSFSVRLKKQYCCLPVVAINAIILRSEELNSMGVPCLTKPICARRTVLVMARNDGGSADRLNK